MSTAIDADVKILPAESSGRPDREFSWTSFLPAIAALAGSLIVLALRVQLGPAHFISDTALMMMALACYLTAAVFHLMNLYAPSQMAQRVGLWATTLGVFLNFSSWLVRWAAAHDRELAIFLSQGRTAADMPWFVRYIPFANLYDLSLAFAFGAGITTLLIAHRKNFRFLGALTLPMAAMILVLARFIGGEISDLQPVLDSYWRPIHVGVASLSYGVAMVCFAIAVVYLLKDGVKTEAMAIWASLFALLVIVTISRGAVPLRLAYAATAAVPSTTAGRLAPIPLRIDLPGVGPLLAVAALLLIAVIVAFSIYLAKQNESARIWGHRLLKLALAVQACGIALLVARVKSLTNLVAYIDSRQYESFGRWVLELQLKGSDVQGQALLDQIAQTKSDVLVGLAQQFIQLSGSNLHLSVNSNPVELAALICGATATLFVIIFSFRTEQLRAALPPLDKLDSLMYKTGSVTFAMLAMLLITGAVWANESWGRYWGWDSKETGAFVAWLTYGVFLHTRIARGWTGRRTAYFALAGFLFVIFTYLGVSYLLPGLHSYA